MPSTLYASTARPAHLWLEDMTKLRADNNQRFKVTIADMVDRLNDPNAKPLRPTSPRSVEACLRLGIDPEDLVYQPPESFVDHNTDKDLAQIAFEHHEGIRQERIKLLRDERQKLVDDPSLFSGTGSGKKAAGGSDEELVERERKRLEVLRRNQERELQQMVGYELMRKQMQEKAESKLARQEERAAAQRAAKAEAERAWATAQREREMKKAQEEADRERENRRIDAERFAREQELLRAEKEAEVQRRKEAYRREQERIAKAEHARMETERILEEQQQAVAKRKMEMEKRDKEREKLKALRQKEKQEANEEARKQAAARLSRALEANKAILAQKRAEFQDREMRNEERRRVRAAEREKEFEAQREKERMKAAKRQDAYEAAKAAETERVNDIVERRRVQEEKLNEKQTRRKRDAEQRALERRLHNSLRMEKVETMRKMQMYRRQQLLDKITAESDRAFSMLSAREALQKQRKEANMQASMKRQEMVQVMDKMQRSKNFNATGMSM